MKPFKVLDLFSGIGGFSFGLEKAGFKTVAFCEIEKDCQKTLKQDWPDIPIYSDIKNLTRVRLEQDNIGKIDIMTGGFPCQDFSCIGQQKGIHNETRSGLWWEMRRLISEIRPRFAVMENVPNFLSGKRGTWFGEFLKSLAEIRYDAQWHCITAATVGKAHLRERLWIVAYPSSIGLAANLFRRINMPKHAEEQSTSPKIIKSSHGGWRMDWNIPEHLRVADGLPFELDEIKSRLKMLGNSIVPEIAYLIGKALRNELDNIFC